MPGPPQYAKKREPFSREQAVARFVREHLAELSDSKASKDALKVLRQRFFEQHNLLPAVRFSGAEAAAHLATGIAEAKRRADRAEVIAFLETIPFVIDEIGREGIQGVVDASRLGDASRLSVDDLSQIGREDFLDKLERDFRHRAEADAEVKLLEERKQLLDTIRLLREKHEVLDQAKSALESVPPDTDLELLVDQAPHSIDFHQTPVWWREMGLETDPFSSNRGLSDIPETKYDDVVVRTPFVQTYVDRIEKTPESFFGKTVVVLGEFGSGKTTLFQLVAAKAFNRGLIPITTSLHPDVSVSRLTQQLVGQLQEALIQSHPHLVDLQAPAGSEGTDDIGRALHTLAESTRRSPTTRGFLLFVDGLHKTEAYLKQSLEFLSQLQTLQERFELRKLRVGVLVAGSSRWETELRANPALSGSFYAIESIPAISEDQAVEAVIRRIRSFTPPGGTPVTIVRAPLRTAYQVLVQRLLHPPTFRDYLDHVRDRFVARDYTTLGVSIRLHTETIRLSRNLIATSPLNDSYKQLLRGAEHSPRIKEGLRKVLPEVCVRKGIKDADPFVSRYKGVFVFLIQHGWLVKRISPSDKSTVWHLSERVVEFLQAAQEPPSKLLPTDTLEALFTEAKEIASTETESIYGPLSRQMEEMVATWRAGLPEIADMVGRALESVRGIDKKCKLAESTQRVEIRDESRTSITLLMRAIDNVVLNSDPGVAQAPEFFGRLWCAPENYESMVQAIQRTTAFDPSQPECYGTLLAHSQVLGDLCELLTVLIRGEGVCRLAGRKLSRLDSEGLHTARVAFLSQQYQATVEKLGDLVEPRIRDVIFPALRCLAGERAITLLPPDIRGRIKEPARGNPRARRILDLNFLYAVNRSEYPKILFGGEIRRSLFTGMLMDDEVESMRRDLELLFSLSDRDAHRDRPSYFREHATEIGTVLQAAPRICEILNRITEKYLTDPAFSLKRTTSGINFRFGSVESGEPEFRMSNEEIESAVRQVLEQLEAGAIEIPPLESTVCRFHSSPEIGLGVLRACQSQGLIDLKRESLTFGLEVELTEKGRTRLDALRSKPRGTT